MTYRQLTGHPVEPIDPRDAVWEAFECYIANDGTLSFADWQAMREREKREREDERAYDAWESRRGG